MNLDNIKMKRIVLVLLLVTFLIGGVYTMLLASPEELVYIIPIEKTIDPGLEKFVERGYEEAENLGADLIMLEVDTPGGLVDAAININKTISASSIPTYALVKGDAISAGAFITISCEKIAMQPGGIIGDAEPRIGTERADEKYVSFFAGKMGAIAEQNGRDKGIAIAMVDRDVEIPDLVAKGKLLTLTYTQAEKYGYADFIVNNRQEFLDQIELGNARIIEAKPSLAESITRLITTPYVAPLLLTIGIAGIIIEIFTLGWGIAGTIGIASLALYFGGHLLAGFTGWGAILLFLLGIILLAIEILVPGFGLPGIGGMISIAVSIIIAAPNWEAGLISLVLAIVGTIILLLISFKFMKKRNIWDRLVLGLNFKKEEGYISQSQDLSKYIGQKGIAFTTLRPSGTAELEDGTKLDVVTEGDFITRGEKIVIYKVEGIRVVVRKNRNETGQ